MQGIHDLGNTQIWGTTIVVATCKNVFRNFLEFFNTTTGANADAAGLYEESFYMKELHVMHRTRHYLLNLNCAHLKDFPATRNFYKQLIEVRNVLNMHVCFYVVDFEENSRR